MKPFSERLRPRSRAMPRSATLCSLLPVKWTRCVPQAAGGQTIRSTCSPAPSTMLDLSVPADRIRSTVRQAVQHGDQLLRVVGRRQQVQVADGRLPAAQRSGRLDAHHARDVAQASDQPADHLVRLVQQDAGDLLLQPRDAGQDVLLGPLGEALDAAQLPVSRRGPQRVHGVDAALLVQQLDRARPDAGNLQDLQQAVRHLRAQLVVVGQAARSRTAPRASGRAPGRRRAAWVACPDGRARRRPPDSARWRRPRGGRRRPCRPPRP